MAEQINERPIGRRDFLKATTLAAAGGVLAAREPAVAASATDKPQAAQPKRGGVLRLAHLSDVIGFDPSQLPLANWPMYFALYDTLLRFDENYKPTPQLAESWDLLDGGKRLVMKLRKGVTFHSGRTNKDPLTMLTTAVVWLPNCEQNKTNYCSDKFAQLTEAAQTTIEPEKRKPILREINELLLSENFTLPIAPNFVAYVKQKGVQGFQANLDGMPIYDDMWIA
jgi:ABC-type transport system substrate-binding protein